MYSWNTSIDDSSSFLTYYPYSDGSFSTLADGWIPWYSGYPGNIIKAPGDESSGQSFHLTSLPGASVYLQFYGTAIYLYGTANCSYDVVLDGEPASSYTSSSSNLLFWQDGLSHATHFVNLTAHPTPNAGQQLAFDQAVFTDSISENANNVTAIKYDNQNKTAVHYSGNWTTLNDKQIPSTANPEPYVETTSLAASVSLNFTGGVAVAIDAARNWGHWTYNVTLDGETSAYNASTFWLIGDANLFYQGGLDPNANHSIHFINTGNAPYFKLDFSSFTVYTPITDSSLPSSGISVAPPVSSTIQSTTSFNAEPTQAFSASGNERRNIGAIVGPVVAVVAIIFVALAFLWWRRRRQVTFEKDETVIPFPRNDRPEPWYKGMEANPIPPTRIVYTATVGSKRPPPPLHPSAIDTVAHTEPRASVDPSASILPPTSIQSTSPSVPSPPQTLDVNQIIELIAQRIDPATRGSVVDELAPPRYPS